MPELILSGTDLRLLRHYNPIIVNWGEVAASLLITPTESVLSDIAFDLVAGGREASSNRTLVLSLRNGSQIDVATTLLGGILALAALGSVVVGISSIFGTTRSAGIQILLMILLLCRVMRRRH